LDLSALWLAISPNDEHGKDNKANDSRSEVFEHLRKRYCCFDVSQRSKSSGKEEAAQSPRATIGETQIESTEVSMKSFRSSVSCLLYLANQSRQGRKGPKSWQSRNT